MEIYEHRFLLLAIDSSRIVRGILCLSMSALSPLLSGSGTGLKLGEEPYETAFSKDAASVTTLGESLEKQSVTSNLTNDDLESSMSL